MLKGNEFATLIWSVGVLKEESFSLLSMWACKRLQCKGHDTLLLSRFFSISSPTCSPSSCTHMVSTQVARSTQQLALALAAIEIK